MAPENGERERLISTFRTTVDEGLKFFGGLSGTSPDVKVDDWGIKEVLSHIIWWHQSAAEGFASIRRGGPPFTYDHIEELRGRTLGMDEGSAVLNARAISTHAGKSVQELIDEIRRATEFFLEEARLAPDLDVPTQIRWEGSTSTIRRRLNTFNNHVQGHVDSFKEAM